ncbi:MAG: hypothetical protein IPH51_08790 [Rubrivivax sp.]|nr:hypothetical protein [Rubrivivax sp.]
MDRREYLVINRATSPPPSARGLEHEAILETAAIGIAVTREVVRAGQPLFSRSRLAPGGLVGQPARVVWTSDQARTTWVRSWDRAGALGERSSSIPNDADVAMAAAIGRVIGKPIDPDHPSKGGTLWIVQDVTDRREFEATLARVHAMPPRPPAAPECLPAQYQPRIAHAALHGDMLGLADLARSPDIDEQRRSQYLDQISESAIAHRHHLRHPRPAQRSSRQPQIETTDFDSASCCARCGAPTARGPRA